MHTLCMVWRALNDVAYVPFVLCCVCGIYALTCDVSYVHALCAVYDIL